MGEQRLRRLLPLLQPGTPATSGGGGGAVDSVNGRTGAVTLTKSDVGLASADNTADAAKNVLTATKLFTSRSISASGDITWTVTFDGSGNVSASATLPTVNANTGTSAAAITMAAGTNHTYTGNATVAIGTSAQFVTTKLATNSYATYRIT